MSYDKVKAGENIEVKINCNSIMLFLVGSGIHWFYLGYNLFVFIQMLTFGGFLIWAIIDFIRLTIDLLKDSEGNDLA